MVLVHRPVLLCSYCCCVLQWYSYIDFLRYSWGALMVNQFSGDKGDPVWIGEHNTHTHTHRLVEAWAHMTRGTQYGLVSTTHTHTHRHRQPSPPTHPPNTHTHAQEHSKHKHMRAHICAETAHMYRTKPIHAYRAVDTGWNDCSLCLLTHPCVSVCVCVCVCVCVSQVASLSWRTTVSPLTHMFDFSHT